MNEPKLTARQTRMIEHVLASPSIEAACRSARVSRSTYYAWHRQPAFRAELDRRAGEIADAAFLAISGNVGRAAETLISLLDTNDPRVQRLSANNLLEQYTKHRELNELAARLDGIEEQLRGKSQTWQ